MCDVDHLVGRLSGLPACWFLQGKITTFPKPLGPAVRKGIASLLGASAACALLAAGPVVAVEPITGLHQFSDVRPTDWAYQALSQLVDRYGCVAGFRDGRFLGERAITRYEAAALLNACLDEVSLVTDELQRLIKEFENELALIRGRVDGLEADLEELEASQFSTTTTLRGQAYVVVNANAFKGSAGTLRREANRILGSTNVLFDLELDLATSFSGKDLLLTKLRTGSFSANNSLSGVPTNQSALNIAYSSNDAGTPVLSVDKLFYQFPLGSSLSFTVGPNVAQDDMFGMYPSLYGDDAILNVSALAGAPLAYNQNQGAGAGIIWSGEGGFSLTASYVAINGNSDNTQQGGIATSSAGGTATVQAGYQNGPWALAVVYSGLQNGSWLEPYGTPLLNDSLQNNSGFTHAFGLGGSWQPADSGWIPSISAGWGINSTSYDPGVQRDGLAEISQSWTVALQWDDVFLQGNKAGMAVGQPVFATSLYGDDTPDDGNYVWEWWYQFQVTDSISITPALFYLSRPLGQETPGGRRFQQLGGLVMTSFSF